MRKVVDIETKDVPEASAPEESKKKVAGAEKKEEKSKFALWFGRAFVAAAFIVIWLTAKSVRTETVTRYVTAPDQNTKYQEILVSSDGSATIPIPRGYRIWAEPEYEVPFDATIHTNQGDRTMKTIFVPAHLSRRPDGIEIGQSFDSMTWRVHSKEPVHFFVCVHQPGIPCPEVKTEMGM